MAEISRPINGEIRIGSPYKGGSGVHQGEKTKNHGHRMR